MINCKNVPQKVIFTISNILATKKQQKQQKQHLLLKVSFFVKIEKMRFFTKNSFFLGLGAHYRQLLLSKRHFDVLNRFSISGRNFDARRNFYGSTSGGPTSENRQKIDFFKVSQNSI